MYFIEGSSFYPKRFPAAQYIEKYNQSSYLDFLSKLLSVLSKFSHSRKPESTNIEVLLASYYYRYWSGLMGLYR
jgi:hypothetical protein